MKRFLLLMTVLAGAASVAAPPKGVVGFVNIAAPAQSDAVISVPMNRAAVFQGVIASIAGNKVTLNSAPSLPAGATYALVLVSGVKEGMVAKITAQSGAQLTVALEAGDDFSGVATGAQGDKANVVPYWTPATLFPATIPAGVKLLTFENVTTAGINLAASVTYVHNGGGVWKDAATGANASAAPLPFGGGFILRNTSVTPLKVMLAGEVPSLKHRLKLATVAANTPQDIRFGYESPVAETLNKAGLGAAQEGDQIFGYNNAATGFNKAPAQMLIMSQGVWKDQFSGQPVGATFKFTPGFGYVFRKAATGAPLTSVWTDLPEYLQANP